MTIVSLSNSGLCCQNPPNLYHGYEELVLSYGDVGHGIVQENPAGRNENTL